jgi:hypothetical protein
MSLEQVSTRLTAGTDGFGRFRPSGVQLTTNLGLVRTRDMGCKPDRLVCASGAAIAARMGEPLDPLELSGCNGYYAVAVDMDMT